MEDSAPTLLRPGRGLAGMASRVRRSHQLGPKDPHARRTHGPWPRRVSTPHPSAMQRLLSRLAPVLLLAALLVPAATPVRAGSAFPAGYQGFHTYAEMVADITSVADAHPTIVRRFSIGRTYLGRTIWAAKVSDNVMSDEAEPEVLFDGLH